MGNEIDVAEKKMVYEVNGQKVELTPKMVMKYLTKGNVQISPEEAISFMKLCQYQELNPFLNEAYLIKYSSNKPADMIVSKEAYMKKAESRHDYQGFKSGLILLRDKKMIEVEGSFKLPTDELLGGWCTVYRSDRKDDIIAKVVFEEYSTGQSTWIKKPCTMIRKVAIVQAHREAFPNLLGGMYTPSESGVDEDDDKYDNGEIVEDDIIEANTGDAISFDEEEIEDVVYNNEGEDTPEVNMSSDGLTEEEKQEILEQERLEAEKSQDDEPNF